MRDAFGGIVNITFIVVFMVIVNGYLAFAANYNKAFRMKNKIISLIEQHEGYDSSLDDTIKGEMHNIGYAVNGDLKPNNTDFRCNKDLGFCVSTEQAAENNAQSSGEIVKKQYNVITAVNIDIPVLRKFLPKLSVFQVEGITKAITQH